MDPFQVRLDCLGLVRRLNASQQSIAKVVDFAVKHAVSASDDVWDCLVSECAKSSLNARLNILFLLDALLISIVDPVGYSSSSSGAEVAQPASSTTLAIAASTYLALASRDLTKIVDNVVPDGNWDAIRLNASSMQKVLDSWRRLGIFEVTVLDRCIAALQERKEALSSLPSSARTEFSKQEILRRMEEDRERHKRLRERAWILPAKSFADALPQRTAYGRIIAPAKPSVVASSSHEDKRRPDAQDIEFEDMWESVSDLNEDDFERLRDDDQRWWGGTAFLQRRQDLEKERQKMAGFTDQQEQIVKEHSASPKRRGPSEERWERTHRSDERPANRWRRIGPTRDSDEHTLQGWQHHHRRGGPHGSSDYAPRRSRW